MLSQAQQMFIDLTDYSYHESGSNEIYMNCPFCGKENKLYISTHGAWLCFRCESKGRSVTSFAMQLYKCSYQKASELLADYNYYESKANLVSHQSIQERQSLFSELSLLQTTTQTKNKTCPALPTNVKLISENLNNPESYPYQWYLKNRGITLEQVIRYKIYYVDYGELKRPSNKKLTIRKSILFPTFRENKLVYWNTRSIEKNPFIKSINAFAKENEYSKKDVIFNEDKITNQSSMVICEGVFNALTCSFDHYVGIATFGKMITDTQVSLMKELAPKNYYIFLDNDAKKQELELIKRLHNLGISYNKIYLVINPYGNKDANDLGMNTVKQLLLQAKPVNLKTLIKLTNGVKLND